MVIIGYGSLWFVLATFSVIRYGAIWGRSCFFQTPGWLACTAQLENGARIGLGLVIAAIFACLLAAGLWLWKNGTAVAIVSGRLRLILLSLGMLALLVVPLGSSDLPYYFSSGKAISEGLNPYNSPWKVQVDFSDPVQSLTATYYAYGPIMATIFHYLYLLTKGNVVLFILGWKMLMLITFVACGLLTVYLCKLISKNNTIDWTVLWFSQPLLLFEWLVNGHFDGLWLLSLLVAIYTAHTKRWWLVLPALTVGVWIKFLPLLFVPFFALWWWQDINWNTWKNKTIQALVGVVVSGAITMASWVPYWVGPKVFDSLVMQSKWAFSSIFATIYYSLKPLFESVLADQAHWYLTRLVQGALLVVVLYMLYPLFKKSWAILLKKEEWESGKYVLAIFIFLLVYTLFWQKSFWPWYMTWFIPLANIAYQATKQKPIYTIITWISTVAVVQHVALLLNSLSKDPAPGTSLWFSWFVVGTIMVHPIYVLYSWRKNDYSFSLNESSPYAK